MSGDHRLRLIRVRSSSGTLQPHRSDALAGGRTADACEAVTRMPARRECAERQSAGVATGEVRATESETALGEYRPSRAAPVVDLRFCRVATAPQRATQTQSGRAEDWDVWSRLSEPWATPTNNLRMI